jgi:hypothetical protein
MPGGRERQPQARLAARRRPSPSGAPGSRRAAPYSARGGVIVLTNVGLPLGPTL